jgi:hypothetical protein
MTKYSHGLFLHNAKRSLPEAIATGGCAMRRLRRAFRAEVA